MGHYVVVGKVDFAVLDRGEVREENESRYVAILDDINMIDIVDAKDSDETYDSISILTERGKEIVVNAMDHEAVKAGAKIISASGCIDGGGDVSLYQDDLVEVVDGETVFVGELNNREKFMFEAGLIVESSSMLVDVPLQMDFKVDGKYKNPVLNIVNLLIEDLVSLLTTKFNWAKSNEAIIKAIVQMFAGANHLEKYSDKIFTDVKAKLS